MKYKNSLAENEPRRASSARNPLFHLQVAREKFFWVGI